MEVSTAMPWVRRNLAFMLLHVLCILGFFWPPSWFAVGLAFLSHYVRAFGLTGGYHRYFAHRTYKMSRPMQFIIAFIGASAAQRGPLWWAGHHVMHHRFADTEEDIHSPVVRSFWWSHLGWHLSDDYNHTNLKAMQQFTKYPELRFLDAGYKVIFLGFLAALYCLGAVLESMAPGLQTNGMQCVVWGGIIPTVTLYHATFCVNSMCHLRGYRRYATPDHSRNNPLVAALTMGEGWHNNHHQYPAAARQGVAWYELDPTFAILWCLEKVGLIHGLRRRPPLAPAV